ncbi:MAG: hypothetical protein HY002_05210 [Candidatus Rokubacteria bacterium]|nr:hypothetical protein [Candidatus Rokubacteria bacterium]
MSAAVLALVLWLAPAEAPAAGLPPQPAGDAASDEAHARAALIRLGVAPDEAERRVSRLRPDERRALVEASDALGIGQSHRTTLGVAVGLALLVVLLLLL